MSYDYFEHCHRFAVWASARAAQRGFTSVDNLRDALESTNIRACLLEPDFFDTNKYAFDVLHRQWCNTIVKFLLNKGIANATFGRAAKLVAIYLKSMVVVGAHSQTPLAAVAHPPIDRLLLQKLASAKISDHKSLWTKTSWTKLDEKGYYELLTTLRTVLHESEPWWMLEQYWTVTNDSNI
jgi:hypothetical protein